MCQDCVEYDENQTGSSFGAMDLSQVEGFNYELFLGSLNYISLHPKEFYMPSWVKSIRGAFDYYMKGYNKKYWSAKEMRDAAQSSVAQKEADIAQRTGEMPHCGTVACFAGHMYLNANRTTALTLTYKEAEEIDSGNVSSEVQKLLGLRTEYGSFLSAPARYAAERLGTIFGMTDMTTYEDLLLACQAAFALPAGMDWPTVKTQEEILAVEAEEKATWEKRVRNAKRRRRYAEKKAEAKRLAERTAIRDAYDTYDED